jgi:hypothetical protein
MCCDNAKIKEQLKTIAITLTRLIELYENHKHFKNDSWTSDDLTSTSINVGRPLDIMHDTLDNIVEELEE